MIYVDSSVALAEIFAEDHRPPQEFWKGVLVASQLTDLEVRSRAAASGSVGTYAPAIDRMASRFNFLGITGDALELLYAGRTAGLRTLDAIHLSTLHFLNRGLQRVPLATYDRRLAAAAAAMGFQVIAP